MAKEKTFWQKHREVIKANLKQHAPWEEWVDAGVSTALTLLLVWLFLHSTITGDLFNSVAEIDSPELIDLYTSTSHRQGVPKYSSILLMPIDGCSRQDVTTALESDLKKAHEDKPLSLLPQIWTDFKKDELANIYKGKGTQKEKESVYDILMGINASQNSTWEQIKK